MNKYVCDACNYKTIHKGAWYNHIKCARHLKFKVLESEKEKNIEVETLKQEIQHKDDIINKQHIDNLKNSLREKDVLINEKDDKFNMVISEIKHHSEYLEKMYDFQRELITEAGGLIRDSMNAMSHILKSYANAPPIINVSYDKISNKNDEFVKDLIYCSKKNSIAKKLGNIIINKYKNNNPEQQQIWVTDTSRQAYVLRCPKEKNDNKNNKNNPNEWIKDKGGVKLKEIIINPLLNDVQKINNEYISKNKESKDNKKLNEDQKLVILENMISLTDINKDIQNNILASNISKYMCPYFSVPKITDK